MSEMIIDKKVLLCGNSGVGKTSIFKRYFKNEFEGNYNSSIGIDFQTKVIKRKNAIFNSGF